MANFINVQFQSKYACPGDTINCIIQLRVTEFYQNAKLICKLKGKEKTALTVMKTRTVRKKKFLKNLKKLTSR